MSFKNGKLENKRLLVAWHKRFKTDPKMRKKMVKDSSGIKNPSKKTASRKAISAGQKRAWADPKIRARRTRALQRAWERDYHWRSVVTDETCKRLAKVMKGRDPIGRPRGARIVWYRGKHGRMAMRSNSEVQFAKLLDAAKIVWLYECYTFEVGRRTWTPDFYIPSMKRFVEVKGWLLGWVKRKIARVTRHYASTTFQIISSNKLVIPTG